MQEEEVVVWRPPEWPPEECGTYSADLKLEGKLMKVFSRKVKQAEGDGELNFTALLMRIDKTSRVADILSESETRTALGPHSFTGTEGVFELWIDPATTIRFKPGDSIVCMTKGACQVLKSVSEDGRRESSVDPLAHMVKKLEKEKAADADGDGAGDDEWDD